MPFFNSVHVKVPGLTLLLILFFIPLQTSAQDALSRGETVYVSIYSNVYYGPKARAYDLSAILSIRNTDPVHRITILKADFYNSKGSLLEHYLEKPLELGPLASTDFYIKEYDERGGTGANFIVKWQADAPVNQPIVEGLMLGMKSGQGISFTCPGKVIKVPAK
ncbi:MAG: DUF3124 domain-containing protein [Deltaproteobacteria bacterium]|jgi:hypothetical protein